MMVRTKSMDLPGRPTLSYIEQGDPAGVPIVLLHGVSDSCHSFAPLLPHLPPSIHVFAISQRGHGDSERPRFGYMPQDFATDLNAFMEVANLGPAIVVGHSMGSSVAECFALNYPERVAGLVLVGAFAGGWQASPAVVELWNNTVSTMTDPIDPGFADAFQRSTLAQPVPPAFLDEVVRESLKLPARVWQAVFESFVGSDFSAGLSAISVPTLIVWGAHDAICPRSEQEVLARSIPYARLVIYEDVGHAPHWEEPARFAGDLADFVDFTIGSVHESVADTLTSIPRANANDESGSQVVAGRI
jgi:non-heme chloroperoxidase